jgi:hypothetical protein
MKDIRYEYSGNVEVFLGNKHVGTIKKAKVVHTLVGWQYFPKGHEEGGEIFPSLSFCQKSLERPSITYEDANKCIRVFRDGERIGSIVEHYVGWKFIPIEIELRSGEPFPTLEACKENLESL